MGEPKALLSIGEETFADRLTGVFGSVCDEVIVVLGFEAERIRSALKRRSECRITVNPEPERGQLSSLQCGLRAVSESADGVLFTPVDSPGVTEATVRKLQNAPGEWAMVIPRWEGRRGHPVGFRAEIAREFLALDPLTHTAREIIHRYQDCTRYVDVEDAAIHWDIDRPGDYERLVKGGTG